MESAEIYVSADTTIRVFLLLLYVPIGLISYRLFIPRLSTTAARLASVMLAAQVLVIVLSLEIRPTSRYEAWLWDLDNEHNIPSTLASTQLALVGAVAMMTAWLAKDRLDWQRLYLVGIGLVFIFLAEEEYLSLYRSSAPSWHMSYFVLGFTIAVSTVVVALCSPRRTWVWHITFLVGIALIALGGIVIDDTPPICGNLGILRLDRCFELDFFDEPLESLGSWLALTAMLGQFSDAMPRVKLLIRAVLYALPALWILILFFNSLLPRLEFPLLAQPGSVQFESGYYLNGYRIESTEKAALIRLYGFANQFDSAGLRDYCIDLVDQISGKPVVRSCEKTDRQHGMWLFGPAYAPLYRQWIEIKIPPQTPRNRALKVLLKIRRPLDGETVRLKVLASDLPLQYRTRVVLGELVAPTISTLAKIDPVAVFDNGFTLDAVDMPERARPGETMIIPFTWRSEVAGDDDLIQFLHVGHAESGEWWIYDQQPLGPRLPTRLWYGDLSDSEIWQVSLPAGLKPGRYDVVTGLYRVRDQQRVPARDAAGNPYLDARVPLGSLMIASGDGS